MSVTLDALFFSRSDVIGDMNLFSEEFSSSFHIISLFYHSMSIIVDIDVYRQTNIDHIPSVANHQFHLDHHYQRQPNRSFFEHIFIISQR